MKFRILALLPLVALTLTLTGCGSSKLESPEAQIQNLKPLTSEDIQLINNEDKRVEEEEGFSVVN